MQWEDVSLTRAEWRIPHTKAGRPHLLPMPQALIATLRSLPGVEGNPMCLWDKTGWAISTI